ncbi:hypothetical protein LTR95_018573 [Oleoguttula sp. CCFEE 5521]
MTTEPVRLDDMEDGICSECAEKGRKVPEALPERSPTPTGQRWVIEDTVDNWSINERTGLAYDGLGGAMRTYGAVTKIDPAEEASEAIKEAVEGLVAGESIDLDVEATAMESGAADMAVEDTADDGESTAMNEEYEKMMAEITDMGL